MTSLIRSLAASAALAGLASIALPANATVLGFDDIGVYGALPANYGGLDWSASSWLAFDDVPDDAFTPHSGNWQLAADFGSADADTTIRFASASVFDGAWFSGYSDSTVAFKLYLGGALVAQSALLATSAASTFLASGYAGLVDTVVAASGQQAFYAMDDFSFHNAVAAVPEPQTWALMFGGLGAIALLARRRRAV
jgi:hypothetical protein